MNTTWGSTQETFNGLGAKKEEAKIEVVTVPAAKTSTAIEVPAPVKVVDKKPHELLFDSQFIKVKSAGKFTYAERKGVDSVAFILIATNASDERRIGLINEFKPPIDSFLTTAFGGSIDQDKYKDNLTQLVIEEVVEEAGFKVSENNVKYYGKVFCSTQMNQFVNLFAVEVDKLKQGERTTTDPLELKSSIVWTTIPEALKLEDWKVATIIAKRLANNDSYAVVRPA